jgi:hypothetical protein
MPNHFFKPEKAAFMLDDVEIGTLFVNMDADGEYVYSLKIKDNVPDSHIPWDFKGLDNKFVTVSDGELHHTLLKNWVEERIFPSDRSNVEELLSDIGLNDYDEWGVLKATRAFSFHDNYWIKLNNEDRKPKYVWDVI